MKRGIAIFASLSALVAVGYFTIGKWAIHHETITFYDASRDNRSVAVDIAVRRDKEMQANAGMIKLPVAILNHVPGPTKQRFTFMIEPNWQLRRLKT